MPPRSAKRKKSTTVSVRAKKSNQNSKQPDVESSISDENAMFKLGNEDQESAASEVAGIQQEDKSAAEKVCEGEGTAQPVVIGKEIEQEIEVLNANSSVIEGLVSGGAEEEVVVNTAVELNIKEEVVEELQNVESAMEDRVDVNTENVVKRETKEDEQNEGGHDENGNANKEDVTEKGELKVECAEVGNVDGSQLGIVPGIEMAYH